MRQGLRRRWGRDFVAAASLLVREAHIQAGVPPALIRPERIPLGPVAEGLAGRQEPTTCKVISCRMLCQPALCTVATCGERRPS